jgi:hypothetical protein
MSLLLLLAGASLFALSFGSEEVLGVFGLGSTASRLVAGALGTVVFAASLIELRLDWAERAALYGAAAERHARLKAQYRNFLKGRSRTASGADELRREYQAVSAAGPGIPERDFLRLKQKHLRKVRLSQMLDDAPGTPIWILRWRLLREGIDRQDTRP